MAGDMQRWLSDIGLGNHAERFSADGIDWDVLPDLTETDLRELGLSVGDRRRLLKAIATMNASGVALAAPRSWQSLSPGLGGDGSRRCPAADHRHVR
jgi:hypothetical protein